MTVFLFVLTQKRVMTAFTNNVLGLMKVMCGTRVTLLSFGTREYWLSSKKCPKINNARCDREIIDSKPEAWVKSI